METAAPSSKPKKLGDCTFACAIRNMTKLLVVDDDPAIRTMFVRALRALGDI